MRSTSDAATEHGTALPLRRLLDGRWAHVRERSRSELADPSLLTDPALDMDAARSRVLKQLHTVATYRYQADGFRTEHGGRGDIGASVTSFEMLAHVDLSLMVKAGVQWGLFGGAVENLGTGRHHDAYVRPLIDLELLGCFAMTETGHGSDVQNLGTTAVYDPEHEEFEVHTPDEASRKDYIGGAARDATMAAVFAQLDTGGERYGVHCFLVPIRDAAGNDLPGVTTSDCGHKGGLNGVDNGRIVFDRVRVPREALLNRYADVSPDGTYSSPIENPSRRFFTMLGTLIRGRVSVAGAAGTAARVALTIATRYGTQRRQFEDPAGGEVPVLDYLVHQRRLLPLVARSYGLQFAQNELVSRLHDIQSSDDPDPRAQRELETRAAGIKALATWHATRTIQECREACGGAGYLTENRLTTLKADTDVFTTFEGDNAVLMQLVAKDLLTAYAGEVGGLDTFGMVRFATRTVADVVAERTAAARLIQRLVDAVSSDDEERDLLERGTQLRMFEDRERHLLETAARRLRRAADGGEDAAFAIYNAAQDHVVHAARAHVDRVVLEAFVAAVDRCEDDETRTLLDSVCDLFALSVVEEDKAWFMEHRRLTSARSKAVSAAVNRLCSQLRPQALTLVEAFGIPDEILGAEIVE